MARILLAAGRRATSRSPTAGACCTPRRDDLTPVKLALAADTADRTGRTGTLADALAGADVFIGVSGGTVPEEVVATMAADAIIFALANPTPEVHPDVAHRHARGGRDRPLGLPEPDQQRARVPRHLPRAPSTSGPPRSPRA